MKNKRDLIDEMLQSLRIMKQLDARILKQLENEQNIPYKHILLVHELTKDHPVTLSEIKKAHHVSASAATQLVNHLDELGYIEKMAHPNDKRSTLISLSSNGLAIVKDLMDSFEKQFEQMIDYIGLEDSHRLNQILLKMIEFCRLNQGEKNEKEK